MKHLQHITSAIVISLFGLSSVSYAKDTNKQPVCGENFNHNETSAFVSCFYIGAGLGYSQFKPDTENSAWDLDDENDFSFSVYGGYQFTESWFTEFMLADLGEASLKYSNPLNPQTEAIDTNVVAAYAGYNLPLHFIPDTQFYIKAGVSYIMHSGSDSTVRLDDSKNLVAPALAGGVQWRFADSWTLRSELNSFSDRTRMADISIAYWFGNSSYRPTSAPVAATPAPEPKEPTLEELEQRNIAALENDQLPAIYVDIGSTELNQAALNELDALVTALNTFPNAKILIQGHTDNVGSKPYNQDLSERRAKRVYQYLVNKGISKARLSTIGYGMDKPVADNSTAEGRSKNRRIDFVISKTDYETKASEASDNSQTNNNSGQSNSPQSQ